MKFQREYESFPDVRKRLPYFAISSSSISSSIGNNPTVKLTVAQLIITFYAFHKTRRFIPS
jgi:hypothetical protein